MTGPMFYAGGGWRVSHTSGVSWRSIVLRDPCPYCCVAPRADFGTQRMTIEHIRPSAHGGTNAWENLTGAHQGCNQQRSAKPLLAFLLFRLRMSTLRGQKGTATRKERVRFRRAFCGTKL